MRDLKNSVQLLGNVGGDVKTGTTNSGKKWANFSLATSKKWTDKGTGEARESTQWHNVGCFEKLAELAEKYIQKGSKILVQGSINYKEYETQEGVKMKSTSIEADEFVFLFNASTGKSSTKNTTTDSDDDLPW